MLFYWRMVEETQLIGENLIFVDPGLRRSFYNWLVRHREMVYLAGQI